MMTDNDNDGAGTNLKPAEQSATALHATDKAMTKRRVKTGPHHLTTRKNLSKYLQ
jgi:hypothetical protein